MQIRSRVMENSGFPKYFTPHKYGSAIKYNLIGFINTFIVRENNFELFGLGV